MSPQEALNAAMERFLSGDYQKSLEILNALPREERQLVYDSKEGRRLAVRLSTITGWGAADTPALLGLEAFKPQVGNSIRDTAGLPDWVARKARRK